MILPSKPRTFSSLFLDNNDGKSGSAEISSSCAQRGKRHTRHFSMMKFIRAVKRQKPGPKKKDE